VLITSPASTGTIAPGTTKERLFSPTKSYSALTDQVPAKAHSTPKPAVQPVLELLVDGLNVVAPTVSEGLLAPTQAPPPPAPVPLYAPPPFSWTGFYLGGNAGGAWIQDNITDSFFGLNFDNRSDFIAGGQIGVNYQVGVFVFGVEGDLDWAANSWRGRAVVTPVGTIQATTNNTWIPTLAARLGIALDRWLFYGKAGGGWIDNDGFAIDNLTIGKSLPGPNNNANTAWLAGAGIEWAVTSNWTLKIEYDHSTLQNSPFVVPVTAPFLASDTFASGNRSVEMVKVGFNYLFLLNY